MKTNIHFWSYLAQFFLKWKMYIGLHVKYPLFLSEFNKTWIFSTKIIEILNFMKMRPVEAELFHADGQ